MNEEHGPIFLVGAERSGSTMLRLMLDHHPEITWQNEFEFAVDLVHEDGSVPGMDRYRDWLSVHRVFLSSGLRLDVNLEYAQAVRSFLEQRRSRSGKQFVGATVHRHFDRLLHFWPLARFIHLVRDPRDVGPSVVRLGWAGNCWTGAKRWAEAETLWDRLATRLDRGRWTDIRYEELVSDPTGRLMSLCEFIGVPYDSVMLDYHRDTSFERPDASLAAKWRRDLAPRDVRLVEARVGSLLQRRGYDHSGHPPLALSVAQRRMLLIQDRVARARFRMARYGLGLQLTAAVSKRVGAGGLHRASVHRMIDIDRRHLR